MNLRSRSLRCVLGLCICVLLASGAQASDISRGDRGSHVRHIQTMLVQQGYLQDSVDGIYGWRTESAVKRFQKAKGLKVNGKVNTAVLRKMEATNKQVLAKSHTRQAPKSYKKKITMNASAYSMKDSGRYTKQGHVLRRGYVAVDPRVIPLGTRVYVEGYGYAIADDIGSAIKGHKIDLAMDSYHEAIQFGRRNLTVYVL